MSASHTLSRLIADRAAHQPGATAVRDQGVSVTYQALSLRIDALAARLRAAGYGAGDRIATLSGNTTDHLVLFFACARIGVAFVPLSWRLTAVELAEMIEQTSPVLVVADEEHGAVAAEAVRLAELAVPVVRLGVVGLELHSPHRPGGCAVQRDPVDGDPLLIIFTSGTGTKPRGVVLTHANCFWTNLALSSAVQLTASDTMLSVLPQFHVAAWNCQPLLALSVGATLVLERSFQPHRALHLIAEHRVTAMMGVPTHYRLLADDPAFDATDLSSLRHVLVGGSTVPSELAMRWVQRGVPLQQGYGLTEAGPNVSCARPGEIDTIGTAYAHVEIMLVDVVTGLKLDGEATGEIWVRGPSVFAGYLGEAPRTDEWLCTGDLATRSADGTLRIVDRLKDIYISGGENVAPAEVEAALETHPAVARAAVVGVPDDVWGERGVAFVVTTTPLSVDELLTHARSRLASFKVPVRVVFVDELPTSSLEKVARARLRARALGEVHS